MFKKSIKDSIPWTPEEDSILIECWLNPNIDCVAVAKQIPGNRTVEAILRRGGEIGLGRKAQHKRTKKSAKKSMAWPDDMPNFEDHPHATAPGSRAKAALLGSRFKTSSQVAVSSPTGSTLDGASINPTGRRVRQG